MPVNLQISRRTGEARLCLLLCLLGACNPPWEGTALVSRWGWIYVTDFDGDGHSDVLTNRLPTKPSHLLGESSVAMLSGAEAWMHVETPARHGHHQASLGDVTGDGVSDLLLPRQTSHILVVPGGSHQTWEEIVSTALPRTSHGRLWLIGLADVDRDGHLDVLLWSGTDGGLVVAPGEGAGLFGDARSVPLPFDKPCSPSFERYSPAALGDFDGDGFVDVVLGCDRPAAMLLVRNSPEGELAAGWRHPMRETPMALALGDFDGDGRLDVATLHLESGMGDPVDPEDYTKGGRLRVHTGWDAEAPSESREFEVGIAPVDLAAGDLDGDGADDIVVANLLSPSFHVLFSARGTPRLVEIDLEHPASAIALGDVDDDGDLDVLLRRSVVDNAFTTEDFPRNTLFMFENHRAGELRQLGTFSFDHDEAP